jgi:signal transduction histidine kinase/AmiR/NasT family two-component response regulator
MKQQGILAAALLLWGAAVTGPAAANQVGTGPAALLERAQAAVPSDAQEGLELARRAADIEGHSISPRSDILLRAAWLEAEALFRLGRYEEASRHLDDVLSAENIETGVLYGKLLIADGRAARSLGRDDHALKRFQEAFAVFAAEGERRYMAISLQAIGTLYQNARQYDRAINYIERSREIGADDPMLTVAGLNNAANAYRFKGEFQTARKLLLEAQSTEAARQIPSWQLFITSNLALVDWESGNVQGAKEALTSIDELLTKHPALVPPHNIGAVKAAILHGDGQEDEAAATLDRTFGAESFTNPSEGSREAHQIAYELYKALGRSDRALLHLEAYKRLVDMERDVAASANLAISNAEFELSAKELEISKLRSERLEAEIAASAAKQRQQRMMGAVAFIVGAGFCLFLAMRVRQSIKLQRITTGHNRELEQVNAELRRTNDALAKANVAKTEFLATTSHEVRTPLNAVINLTESVLLELDAGSQRQRLQTALRSAEHLHAIVSDILDVARLEGNRVEARIGEVDIVRTVTDVANLWAPKAKEKNITFNVSIDPSQKRFRTDDKLLRQILSNLLSNAVKFTKGGEVELQVQGETEGENLILTVRDTGIGIREQDQEEIFESFRQVDGGSTRSYGGTGLGLAICRQVAELLGGGITVDSTFGEGATFTVTLPPGDQSSEDLPSAEVSPRSPGGSHDDETLRPLRILAAEDNAVNAMVIQAILQNKVGALTIVENGAEAVSAVENGDFDVVLMDKQMPIMDGVEAIKRIRALGGACRNIPIIAVTADAFAEAREELLSAGANRYLAKPVKPDELKSSIVTTLNERTSEALAKQVR